MAIIGSMFADTYHMELFGLSDDVHKLLETIEYKDGLISIRSKLNEMNGIENE